MQANHQPSQPIFSWERSGQALWQPTEFERVYPEARMLRWRSGQDLRISNVDGTDASPQSRPTGCASQASMEPRPESAASSLLRFNARSEHQIVSLKARHTQSSVGLSFFSCYAWFCFCLCLCSGPLVSVLLASFHRFRLSCSSASVGGGRYEICDGN